MLLLLLQLEEPLSDDPGLVEALFDARVHYGHKVKPDTVLQCFNAAWHIWCCLGFRVVAIFSLSLSSLSLSLCMCVFVCVRVCMLMVCVSLRMCVFTVLQKGMWNSDNAWFIAG